MLVAMFKERLHDCLGDVSEIYTSGRKLNYMTFKILSNKCFVVLLDCHYSKFFFFLKKQDCLIFCSSHISDVFLVEMYRYCIVSFINISIKTNIVN